jgi:hypothetical protein
MPIKIGRTGYRHDKARSLIASMAEKNFYVNRSGHLLALEPVVCQKPDEAGSGGGSIIEVEQTAKSFPSDEATVGVRGLGRAQGQPVLEALMIPFAVIVVDEFGDRPTKMALTERDDSIKALASDGKDESLREGVEIGAPRRQTDDLHAAAFERTAITLTPNSVRIAGLFIKQVDSSTSELAVDRHERVHEGPCRGRSEHLHLRIRQVLP